MSDVTEAMRVLDIEANAILGLKAKIGENFVSAVETIVQCKGKVIVAGMGKSGHIGRKIAATMSSTGTPALFLHPAESSHGDMGIITPADVLIIISYGGGSNEITDLLGFSARKGIPLIGITGNLESNLAQSANSVLDVSVEEEACPLGLAPTSSSTATLAMGDALAMAVLKRKGFREEDFAEFHPGGRLGRRLLTRVRDIMHENGHLPIVNLGSLMTDVVTVMTGSEVRGVAAVVDENKNLVGVITDGDIRRHLEKNQNPLSCRVEELMSHSPKTIDASELAAKALFVMEQFTINSLFVVDLSKSREVPIGVIHLQDLLKAKI